MNKAFLEKIGLEKQKKIDKLEILMEPINGGNKDIVQNNGSILKKCKILRIIKFRERKIE